MENTFSKNLVLLRKEKGLSQKAVAADLNISQALLSHYEKGIRECGLTFVLRCSVYFGVSCDFLLGAEQKNSPEEIILQGGKSQSEKNIISSLNIVFSILKKINNKMLTAQVINYLCSSVYTIIRLVTKNGKQVFSADERLWETLTENRMNLSKTKSRIIISDQELDLPELDSGSQAIRSITRITEGEN